MIKIPPTRILVPVDFSETSFAAWDYGEYLAKAFGARIEAVYIDDALSFEFPPMPKADLTEEVRQALIARLRRRLGPDADVDVVEGNPALAILRMARLNRADMIVMGTHGRTGLPRVLFGSVAEAVMRYSPVPVLTIRGKWRPIKSILAPINGSHYSIEGFLAAAEMAKDIGARIDALYVGDDRSVGLKAQTGFKAASKKLSSYFQKEKTPEFLVRKGDPVEGIVKAAGYYDLVVLIAHHKQLIKDWVMGATVERVLRHSPAPVLALPDPGRGPLLFMSGLEKATHKPAAKK